MKETRRLAIKQKVFTKSNFTNIAKMFFDEHKTAQENKKRVSIESRVVCSDNTSYESESIELFDEESILDLKKTKAIELTFHNYTEDSYMNISVVHGGGYHDEIIIRGKDRNWVDGMFTRLKENIDSIKPQENFILQHKTALLHVIALGVGIFIYFVLWLVIYQHIEPIKNPSETVKTIRIFFKTYPYLSRLLNGVMAWLFGIPWAVRIMHWLLRLWPSNEFDFGPEHFKIEKQRRMRIAAVFSIAVLPIVISLGHDLIKYMLSK